MEKKIGWWKKPFAWLLDSDWDLDPYKVAAFLLLWQFSVITAKVMALVDEKTVDVGLVGIVAGLLVPLSAMITFLFNYSKEHDKKLIDSAKEQ